MLLEETCYVSWSFLNRVHEECHPRCGGLVLLLTHWHAHKYNLSCGKQLLIFLIFTNCTFYCPFLIADFDLAPCFSLWHLCAVSLWYLLIFLFKHPSYRRQYCVPALEELRSNNWDTPSGFTAKETNERRLWLTDGEARWHRGSLISIALRRNWIKKKKKKKVLGLSGFTPGSLHI